MKKYEIRRCPALDDQGRCMAGDVLTGNYLRDCEEMSFCRYKKLVAQIMETFGIEEVNE